MRIPVKTSLLLASIRWPGGKQGVRRFAAITVPLDEAAVKSCLICRGDHFCIVDPPGGENSR